LGSDGQSMNTGSFGQNWTSSVDNYNQSYYIKHSSIYNSKILLFAKSVQIKKSWPLSSTQNIKFPITFTFADDACCFGFFVYGVAFHKAAWCVLVENAYANIEKNS
jgi:hypothetical protein